MVELLILADPEVAAIAELEAAQTGTAWASAHVGTKIPTDDPKPDLFVRVVAAGGSQRDLVTDEHLLVLDAFATREQDARDLDAWCVAVIQRAAISGALGAAVCSEVKVAGVPANLPDPDVPDRFRFTATVSVALRRVTA